MKKLKTNTKNSNKKVNSTTKTSTRDVTKLSEDNKKLYTYLQTLINARPSTTIKAAAKAKATYSVDRLVEILSKDRYKDVSVVPTLIKELVALKDTKGIEVNTYYLLQTIYNILSK